MDDFTSKITLNVIVELFKESIKGGKWLSEVLFNKSRTLDLLGNAASEYGKNLAQRYNVMRIFGMSKPVPLQNIYTRLNVLEKITSRQHSSVDDLLEIFEVNQRRFGVVSSTRSGIEVVNDVEKFIILGKPGSGKTTFLKHVLLECLAGRLQKKRVPVFVSLKDLSDSEVALFDRMVREFEICNVPSAGAFLESLLASGKCLVLLDGLDEVGTERRQQIIKEIIEISEQYRNSQYIVSCRIAAYNYWFDKFVDVEVADFGEEEIRTFASNWFADDSAKSEGFWSTLERNSNVRELASTPLLLTMLCLAYEETMDFAANRAEIYKDAIEALLKKWDKSRSINREQVYRNFTVKRKEEMLSTIAATTFESEEYFFPQERIVSLVRSFISHLPEVSEGEVQEDAQAILVAVEEQHGLIVERATGIYSFSHLTFQEYFTASYVVSAGRESQKNLVYNHLEDVRWREVIILVANLLPIADEYVMLMIDKMVELGFSGRYRDMLREDARMRQTRTVDSTIRTPLRGKHLTLVRTWEAAPTAETLFAFLKKRRELLLGRQGESFYEVGLLKISEDMLNSARSIRARLLSSLRFAEDRITSSHFAVMNKAIEFLRLLHEGCVAYNLKMRESARFYSQSTGRDAENTVGAIISFIKRFVAHDARGDAWSLSDEAMDDINKAWYNDRRVVLTNEKGQWEVLVGTDGEEELIGWSNLAPFVFEKEAILAKFWEYLVELYEQYGAQYSELRLLVVAETVAELVSCPIYIRKETRRAAMLTIAAMGEPRENESA